MIEQIKKIPATVLRDMGDKLQKKFRGQLCKEIAVRNTVEEIVGHLFFGEGGLLLIIIQVRNSSLELQFGCARIQTQYQGQGGFCLRRH